MIIALKRKKKTVVAVSVVDQSSAMTDRDLMLPENLPFWQIKGVDNCYAGARKIGFAVDLLRYHDEIFEGITDAASIRELVVPKMKELLKKYDMITSDGMWQNLLVIVKDDKIYTIDDFFSVWDESEYLIETLFIDDYIKGTLDDTKDLSAEDSILTSLRTYQSMGNRRGFPVMIYNLTDKTKKVYYR